MKSLIILGSTGSIGTQCLDIVRIHRDRFTVSCLCCGKRIGLLREQIEEFAPRMAVVAEEKDAEDLRRDYPDLVVLSGDEGLREAAAGEGDLVVNALVGIRGLAPTLAAIEAGKDIALANKETLVTGGELVMRRAAEKGVKILPVDSEHSAIFQCLEAAMGNRPASVILTASGGPFRGYSLEQLENVTLAQALAHPNWSMGRKITVDSASMVNKCLEIIEAKHLFGMAPSEIEVVVHPQSIVHSMVRFTDGAVLAQLGTPDMRVPIAYALDWPKRDTTGAPRLDFAALTGGLTFEVPDTNVFRTIPLAYESLQRGGTATAALNGANEVLVAAFLAEKIRFIDIQNTLLRVMDRYENTALDTIEDVFEADATARRMTEEVLSSL